MLTTLLVLLQVQAAPLPAPSVAASFDGGSIKANIVAPVGKVEWAFIRAGGWQANRDDWQETWQPETTDWSVAMLGFETASRPPTAAETAVFRLDKNARVWCSATALVRRPGREGASPVATSSAGVRFELQPLFDPTTRPGADIPVRVRAGDGALYGVPVYVSIDGSRKPLVSTSDGNGNATIPHMSGSYRIWAWRVEGGDLYSTSLTYEVMP